jgi:putative Mg2+ transporter-C (MgtC) family protein
VTDLELAKRLFLSLLFGTLVGLERQWHHKTAGLKTNTLVAVGATAFTLVAQLGFGPGTYLPQVAAGVVTGIGFIGGGVIMRRGGNVQGINSAATLWATASMGLAIGAGYYPLAWLILGIVLMIQFVQHGLALWIDRRSHFISVQATYLLQVELAPEAEAALRAAWADFAARRGVSVLEFSDTRSSDSQSSIEARMGLSETRVQDLIALTRSISGMPGVQRAAWSRVPVEEADS